MMNSRVYFGEPETRIPFPLAAAPAIETLLQLEPGDSVPVVDLVVVESDEGGVKKKYLRENDALL